MLFWNAGKKHWGDIEQVIGVYPYLLRRIAISMQALIRTDKNRALLENLSKKGCTDVQKS